MSDAPSDTGTDWNDYICDYLASLTDEERTEFARLTAHFAAENQRILAERDQKTQEQGQRKRWI